ncbi:hypothetical protein V5799_012963 [Amblyomma americanum]|uniref:Uncharacterized protein n=1 Tax=Amblyomma americanum TaxID=6943 RepID=A0AAQ4E7A1_AMBAM
MLRGLAIKSFEVLREFAGTGDGGWRVEASWGCVICWRRLASLAAAGEHRGAAGSPGRSGFAAAAGAGPGRLSRQRGRGVQPESPVAGCRQGRGCPEHLARARLPGRRRRRQQQRRDSAGGVARGPAGPVTCVEASFTCPAFMKQLCAGVFVCLRGDRYLPTTLPQSMFVETVLTNTFTFLLFCSIVGLVFHASQ